MEIWDVYDRDRQKTGRTMVRGEQFEEGCYHLVIHVCLFNSDGNMLIQQRQPFKEGWPNMWDVTVGGSAIAGENAQMAAARELYEEIGVRVDFSEIRPQFTIHFDHGFDDVFLIEHDVNLQDCILQPEEVQAVRYATCEEICQMIKEGTFIPYQEHFIRLCFERQRQKI